MNVFHPVCVVCGCPGGRRVSTSDKSNLAAARAEKFTLSGPDDSKRIHERCAWKLGAYLYRMQRGVRNDTREKA